MALAWFSFMKGNPVISWKEVKGCLCGLWNELWGIAAEDMSGGGGGVRRVLDALQHLGVPALAGLDRTERYLAGEWIRGLKVAVGAQQQWHAL